MVALLLGSLARHFHMPSLVGELCAGLLLGPSILGQLSPSLSDWFLPRVSEQFHLLDAVGQLGVLMLVGLTGIEVKLHLLRRHKHALTRISIIAAVVPFCSGVGVGYLLPNSFLPVHTNRLIFALFLGVALSVSAIPVIAKTLTDMKLLHSHVGQLTLASATINDIFGWFMLSVVSAMAMASGVHPAKIMGIVLSVLLLLLLSWIIGRKIIHKVLALVRRTDDDGPTVTAMIAMILGYAAITQALGLEPVLGAFICGILIGADAKFKAIRLPTVLAVLAPLFFATAGLRINLGALAHPAVLAAACAILAVAFLSKFLGAYVGARFSKIAHWDSFAIGGAMNARGVVEIVIASVGIRLGILNTATYTIIILVAIVTSLMAPLILRYGMARVGGQNFKRLAPLQGETDT